MPYDEDYYTSEDECILDIVANTDAPYTVAKMAAPKVYLSRWSFNNGPTPRSVVISPDFDDPDAPRVTLIYSHNKEDKVLCACPSGDRAYCRYDENIDPAHDECLHCGLPEERK